MDSVYYSAKLVYGVKLEAKEYVNIKNYSCENNVSYNKWLFDADVLSPYVNIVLGIECGSAEEGTVTQLDKIKKPKGKEFDELLKILKTFNINRNPTWYLIGKIS